MRFLFYIDNVISHIKPFESHEVKATVSILVVLLTLMTLFAIFGWGFCLVQWRIMKRQQSIRLSELSDSGRTHNDKG